MEIKDLRDGRFGTYTVNMLYSHSSRYGIKWLCTCNCGRIRIIRDVNLRMEENIPICPCKIKKKKDPRERIEYRRIMRNRSEVCRAWINGFDMFLRNMGEAPSRNHYLKRIDENQPYSKDNCVWENESMKIEHNGQMKTVSELSKELNIPSYILYSRIRIGSENLFAESKTKRKTKRKRVLKCNIRGKVIKEYESIKEASEKTEIDKRSIGKCCNGKAKTAGGFFWRYKESSE